jgi:hypothetical protein
MGASAELTETTCLVWYCGNCRNACKVQPQGFDPSCTCATPVVPMHPTRVTQVHAPGARSLHALSDEEGRLRALAHKGTKVRVTVTYEGEIADAWQWSSAGRRGLGFIVATADGQRHSVDPQREGVRIEGVADEGEQS